MRHNLWALRRAVCLDVCQRAYGLTLAAGRAILELYQWKDHRSSRRKLDGGRSRRRVRGGLDLMENRKLRAKIVGCAWEDLRGICGPI